MTGIGDDAFECWSESNLIIKGIKGSYAELYAKDYGCIFVAE